MKFLLTMMMWQICRWTQCRRCCHYVSIHQWFIRFLDFNRQTSITRLSWNYFPINATLWLNVLSITNVMNTMMNRKKQKKNFKLFYSLFHCYIIKYNYKNWNFISFSLMFFETVDLSNIFSVKVGIQKVHYASTSNKITKRGMLLNKAHY